MASAALIAVEEYLEKTYRPDREYVDGLLIERNLGELDHSQVQTEIAGYFWSRRADLKVVTLVEQRVQVSKSRFRIPDVCVLSKDSPRDQVVQTPPLLCIEVLSKDDRMSDMQERIDDYLHMGVPCVWVIDPRRKTGFLFTLSSMVEARDRVLRCDHPQIEVPLDQFFTAPE